MRKSFVSSCTLSGLKIYELKSIPVTNHLKSIPVPFTYSKLTIETLEQDVKYVRS